MRAKNCILTFAISILIVPAPAIADDGTSMTGVVKAIENVMDECFKYAYSSNEPIKQKLLKDGIPESVVAEHMKTAYSQSFVTCVQMSAFKLNETAQQIHNK